MLRVLIPSQCITIQLNDYRRFFVLKRGLGLGLGFITPLVISKLDISTNNSIPLYLSVYVYLFPCGCHAAP